MLDNISSVETNIRTNIAELGKLGAFQVPNIRSTCNGRCYGDNGMMICSRDFCFDIAVSRTCTGDVEYMCR